MPAGDQGSRVFASRLVTAGDQTITATDATGGWSCTAQVTINPAAPQIHVMLPTDANASHPVEATVSVKDTYGNAISYAGTLSFSSTDTAAVLPADSHPRGHRERHLEGDRHLQHPGRAAAQGHPGG